MDFIECENVQGIGYCTDNDCSCTLTPLSHGKGYIYISDEVVNFRSDALSVAEAQSKLERLCGAGEYVSISRYAPILICDAAAEKRNLDLAIAKEDALLYWNNGRVPLRATPCATGHLACSINNDPIPQTPQLNPDYVSVDTSALRKRVQQGSDLPDVSVDDVMVQYSSGPLAELAKRMANDLEKSDSGNSDWAYDEPQEETLVTNGSKIKYLHTDVMENTSYQHPTAPQFSTNGKSGKTSHKPVRKAGTKFSVVFGILLILALSGAITVFLIFKFFKDKPVGVETSFDEIVEPATQQPEIHQSFFGKSYLFEDARYKGSISFTLSSDSSGTYLQSVFFKENNKTFKVHGGFSYSIRHITFRPDSYSKDIQWILDEYDQDGCAVFHDPSELNSELARVFLCGEK